MILLLRKSLFSMSHVRRTNSRRALYRKGDPYEKTDAVFGVKESLIVEVKKVTELQEASKYGVEPGCALITYDFVLVKESEAEELRKEKAQESASTSSQK